MVPPSARAALFACVLVACGGAAKPAAPTAAPPVEVVSLRILCQRYRIANGLEVILHESHEAPLVAVNLYYHVGSRDDPPSRSGFAHLFEHLMFQGSRHVAKDEFMRQLENAGARDQNATTDVDRTAYFETVPSNRLELALWLESDRLAFLLDRLDQSALDRQREVVKNERRQRFENVAYGLVPGFVNEAMYPVGHPYRRLGVGTPEDLDAATLEEARAFFRTFYVPSNATLVLAGDFDPTTVKGLIERYFGPIPPGAKPPPTPAPAPTRLPREVRLRIEADVQAARVVVTWPAPAAFAPGDAELQFARRILAWGATSRLYRRLVHDEQIAQSVGARHLRRQLGGQFEVSATVRPGQSPEAVLGVLDAELGRLATTLPDDAELRQTRYGMLAGTVFAVERLTSRADVLNSYDLFTGDPSFIERDLERDRRVTRAAVRDAVAAHLRRDGRIVTFVLPTPTAPRAGRLAAAP